MIKAIPPSIMAHILWGFKIKPVVHVKEADPITGCLDGVVQTSNCRFLMYEPTTDAGTTWRDNKFLKKDKKSGYDLIASSVEVFEKWMREQFLNYFKTEYNRHIPGIICTNVPVHQGLHVDNQHVLKHPKHSALVYHIPLCPEGLRVRITKLHKKENSNEIVLHESMVEVNFGDALILDSAQVHSGNYGVYGNLRLHGVFSNFKWEYKHLLPLESIATRLYGTSRGDITYETEPINDYCPNCFRCIKFVNAEQHFNKCQPRVIKNYKQASLCPKHISTLF